MEKMLIVIKIEMVTYLVTDHFKQTLAK